LKHARADYDRFQDPTGKIPEDEPVMIFRGQDALAPYALDAYATMAEIKGLLEIATRVREHAARMRAWTIKKYPDL
jgi:hypothetical protein